jgi:hypothetical protein
MKPDELEKKLSRQPLRTVPTEWRKEILAIACTAQLSRPASRIPHHGLFSTLAARLSSVLWPHPRAWAALAAAWVLILALDFSTHDTSPAIAENFSPPSPEAVAELKKQRRLFAELVGGYEAPEADRPRIFSPRPRSGRGEFLAA